MSRTWHEDEPVVSFVEDVAVLCGVLPCVVRFQKYVSSIVINCRVQRAQIHESELSTPRVFSHGLKVLYRNAIYRQTEHMCLVITHMVRPELR